ncbi:TPA: hypothetical protein EYP70_08455, partial [Candidatus Bathyarchaeota archaeon]|nr:hypothetical protein [Candidatus Bathyarchaeota archaeon]
MDLLEILSFKKRTIDYSLDKMEEAYNIIFPKIEKGEKKVVTGSNIGESAWLISCYGEYFFLEVTSFFDALARNLTKNQDPKKDIHFHRWIGCQYKNNKNDDFICYLKQQLDNWYRDFKKIRNTIAHQSHLYYEIDKILHIDFKTGEKVEFETCTMRIGENNIELVDYCKDIQEKLEDMIAFIENNNYWKTALRCFV